MDFLVQKVALKQMDGMTVDPMQGMYLGITKWLLGLRMDLNHTNHVQYYDPVLLKWTSVSYWSTLQTIKLTYQGWWGPHHIYSWGLCNSQTTLTNIHCWLDYQWDSWLVFMTNKLYSIIIFSPLLPSGAITRLLWCVITRFLSGLIVSLLRVRLRNGILCLYASSGDTPSDTVVGENENTSSHIR